MKPHDQQLEDIRLLTENQDAVSAMADRIQHLCGSDTPSNHTHPAWPETVELPSFCRIVAIQLAENRYKEKQLVPSA